MEKVIVLTDAELKRKIDPNFIPRSQKFENTFRALGADVKLVHCADVSLVCADGKSEIYHNKEKIDRCDVLVNFLSGTGNVLEYDFLARNFEEIAGKVINKSDAILVARNKYRTYTALTEKGIKVPKSTYVTAKTWKSELERFEFPIIVKMTTGNRGIGVMKFDSRNSLAGFIDFYFKGSTNNGFVIQEYISESVGKDLRIIVLFGKIVAVMERNSQDTQHDFRSNISRGAKALRYNYSQEEADIAIRAAEATGLDFCGVDLMHSKNGPLILEVNCMPGLEGIQTVTDFDLFEHVAKEILK